MRVSKGKTLGAVSPLCLGVLTLVIGCPGQVSDQGKLPRWSPEQYFSRMAQIGGQDPRVLVDEEERDVRRTVRSDVANGYQDSLAAFILKAGPWRGYFWYWVVEEEFAEVWRRRQIPLRMAATPKTMDALRRIAEAGVFRQARVAAALAMVRDDKELATAVLAKEYATFEVTDIPWRLPLPAGTALANLGTPAVAEVTTIYELKKLLDWGLPGPHDHRDPRLLARAANLYNKRLRELFDKGDTEEVQALADMVEKSRLALQCYREAEKEAQEAASQPGKNGGLFGP
jgi:hypothetical protein